MSLLYNVTQQKHAIILTFQMKIQCCLTTLFVHDKKFPFVLRSVRSTRLAAQTVLFVTVHPSRRVLRTLLSANGLKFFRVPRRGSSIMTVLRSVQKMQILAMLQTNYRAYPISHRVQAKEKMHLSHQLAASTCFQRDHQ